MTPLSTKERLRLSPPAEEGQAAPVYVARVPSWRDRAAWQRELLAMGARYPSDRELRAAARAALAAAMPDNAAEMLALLDRADAAEAAKAELDPADLAALAALDATLARTWPPFVELAASRGYWNEAASYLAFEMFVTGAEGEGAQERPVRLQRGRVAEDCLLALPRAEVMAVGDRIIAAMFPTKAQEKNSVSPSPSA